MRLICARRTSLNLPRPRKLMAARLDISQKLLRSWMQRWYTIQRTMSSQACQNFPSQLAVEDLVIPAICMKVSCRKLVLMRMLLLNQFKNMEKQN